MGVFFPELKGFKIAGSKVKKKGPKASLFHALSHILYTLSQNITSSHPNNFLLVITSLVDLEVAFTKGFLQGSQRPKYGSRLVISKQQLYCHQIGIVQARFFLFFLEG